MNYQSVDTLVAFQQWRRARALWAKLPAPDRNHPQYAVLAKPGKVNPWPANAVGCVLVGNHNRDFPKPQAACGPLHLYRASNPEGVLQVPREVVAFLHHVDGPQVSPHDLAVKYWSRGYAGKDETSHYLSLALSATAFLAEYKQPIHWFASASLNAEGELGAVDDLGTKLAAIAAEYPGAKVLLAFEQKKEFERIARRLGLQPSFPATFAEALDVVGIQLKALLKTAPNRSLYDKACQFLFDYQSIKAEPLFRKLMDGLPKDSGLRVSSWFRWVTCLTHLGDPRALPEAKKYIRFRMKNKMQTTESWFEQLNGMLTPITDHMDFDKSLSMAEYLLKHKELDLEGDDAVRILGSKGQALLYSGRPAEARTCFEQQLSLLEWPENIDLTDFGLTRGVNRLPQLGRNINYLAESYRRSGELEQGLKLFSRSISLEPGMMVQPDEGLEQAFMNSAYALLGISRIYFAQAKYRQAYNAAKKGLSKLKGADKSGFPIEPLTRAAAVAALALGRKDAEKLRKAAWGRYGQPEGAHSFPTAFIGGVVDAEWVLAKARLGRSVLPAEIGHAWQVFVNFKPFAKRYAKLVKRIPREKPEQTLQRLQGLVDLAYY